MALSSPVSRSLRALGNSGASGSTAQQITTGLSEKLVFIPQHLTIIS
jgi:hypothetical protein